MSPAETELMKAKLAQMQNSLAQQQGSHTKAFVSGLALGIFGVLGFQYAKRKRLI